MPNIYSDLNELLSENSNSIEPFHLLVDGDRISYADFVSGSVNHNTYFGNKGLPKSNLTHETIRTV